MGNTHFIFLTVILAWSGVTQAGLIDFETDAFGTTPTDNGSISRTDTFMAGGVLVSFGFDTTGDGITDTNGVFEEAANRDTGDNDTGFWGIDGARDAAAPGFEDDLGRFFLRQETPYAPFGTFIISYEAGNSVTAASGEIWDIDGRPGKTEQFLVEAFGSGSLLASELSPLGNTLDLNGAPWRFGFDGLAGIDRLEITFTGSKTRGIGLAFNNFAPTQDLNTVPNPSTVALLGLGFIGMARWRRNQHQRRGMPRHLNS